MKTYLFVLFFVLLFGVGVADTQGFIFKDVTENAGISAPHHAVYMITGQAWGDVDNDGWIDLYVTDSAGDNHLYLNNGDETFRLAENNDVVALPNSRSGGTIFADYDNDGWQDLYVVNWGANVLFHNEAGQGWRDVTETAGVGNEDAGKSATWGDYDNDGYLDLYVANWSCYPECGRPFEGDRDRLYHNNGDGTFTDVTNLLRGTTRGAGFVAVFLDIDDDGDQDIYVVNDEFINPVGNKLFRNDGAGCDEWCFTEIAHDVGADTRVMGMGVSPNDFDNDGDFDFFFSNGGPMVLLENAGNTFTNRAENAGVALNKSAIGWGSIFLDYDHDGWQDLYLALSQNNEKGGAFNPLFRNMGDGSFVDVSGESGADNAGKTLGVASADFNHDGYVDFVIGNENEGYFLYQHQAQAGAKYNWLSLKLHGGNGVNLDAVGTKVTVTTRDGHQQTQSVISGGSLGAGHDLTLNFGLAGEQIQTVTVRWTNGTEQNFSGRDFQENRRYALTIGGDPLWLDAVEQEGVGWLIGWLVGLLMILWIGWTYVKTSTAPAKPFNETKN
jgi:hypothetical protein